MKKVKSFFPRGKGTAPKGGNKRGLTWLQMISEEDRLQKSICEVLDLLKIDYYSIPNGTHKASALVKWLFDVTGLKSGVPDLHLPMPCYEIRDTSIPQPYGNKTLTFYSLYIEVKTATGVLSKQQKEWHKRLREYGHYVAVVRSTKEVELLILKCYPEHAKKFVHLLQLWKLQNNNPETWKKESPKR